MTNKIASPLSVLVRKKGDIDLMVSLLAIQPFNRQRRNTLDREQMKRFIDEMSKTGKLEGLEYTYWDKEFISKVGAL
ncbi:hypothetical protein Pint_16728 [Pistacia integerrima]|uniref:Uncharacterized protein n=1 Tax=Pistacia integerrima TaxID=434235 RepID=A0ACC0ZBU2_9ROSI|nr:hypothetical protein Pint_16728 [Pistacia integerrima]